MVKSLRLGVLLFGILVGIAFYLYNSHETLLPSLSHLDDTSWLEERLTDYFHQPVHIADSTVTWQGLLHPYLQLEDFSIQSDTGEEKLHIKKLVVGIDLINSLSKGKLIPGDITLEGTKLNLQEEGHGIISINDIPTLEINLNNKHSDKLDALLDAFLSSGHKKIVDLDVSWFDQSGKLILPLHHISADSNSWWFIHNITCNAQTWRGTPVAFNGRVFGLVGMREYLFTKVTSNIGHLVLEKNPLLQRYLPQLGVARGDIDLSMNFSQKPKKNLQISGSIHSNDLHLLDIKTNHFYPDLNFNANYKLINKPNHFSLLLNKLNLQLQQQNLPIHKIVVDRTSSLASAQTILKTDQFPIQTITNLLHKYNFLAPSLDDAVLQLKPSGDISEFEMRLTKQIGNPQQQLSFRGELNNVSFEAWHNYPGFTHLYGKLNFTPNSGNFTLNGKDTLLSLPKVFPQPLVINYARGQLDWVLDKTGTYHITFKNYKVATKDAETTGYFNLAVPPLQSDIRVDAKSSFKIKDLSHIAKYYPENFMHKNLVIWLEHSIKEGKLKQGLFIMKGRLKDFPFDQNRGKFSISGNLTDGVILYKKGWPALSDLNAKLVFEGRTMTILANKASMLGVKVNHLTARIADLGHALLLVKGDLKSTPASYTQLENPFYQKIQSDLIKDLNIHGEWLLGLNLTLPLNNALKLKTTYDGQLLFNNVTLGVPGHDNFLSNMIGSLHFTENRADSKLLTGKVFNQPFKLTVSSHDTTRNTTLSEAIVQSTISSQQLQSVIPQTLFENLSGEFPFQASFNVEAGNSFANALYNLVVRSDLIGLQSKLPAPLAKESRDKLPSELVINNTNQGVLFKFRLADQMNGIVQNVVTSHNAQFERGTVQFGAQTAQLTADKGLVLLGKIPELNWPLWQNVIGAKHNDQQSVIAFNKMLTKADITFDRLTLFNQVITPMHLQLDKESDYIAARVNSDVIKGNIKVPLNYPNSPILANLELLNLVENQSELKPSDLLPIDVTIAKLNYHNKVLQNVLLKLRPHGEELFIKQAQISEPGLKITANGVWRDSKTKQNTALNGEIETKNLGAFLNQWHITDNVVKGEGNAQFNLMWSNSPMHPESKTLNGSMTVNFRQGRIIKLGDQADFGMGVGRLLNLLSLQTLPRRLMGDFSDLTESGYSFDQLRGQLQFRQGNIYTDDAYLDGTVGKVKINGRIGLANKDYDLRLIINPNVTSSLPVVATLTAGPIIGAATWLVDKVFSREVKKMTEIHYNVTGSWDHPNMHNLNEKVQ